VIRDDYLMRQIKQAAQALARLLGLRKAGEYDKALELAEELYESLGIPRGLHDVVDSPTLASMLRSPCFVEEGHIFKAKGDPLAAFKCYRRAHELILEARAIEPIEDDENMLLELARWAPAHLLDERYRS
jgi:tetratricopeptide (TPR) repeat protein